MMHDLRGRHLIGLGTLIGLLSLPLVGCASGPQPPPTATASTTPVARYATPKLPPTMQRLPLPPALGALPSPDGTLIAALDTQQTTVTLYDLAGAAHGHATVSTPAGTQLGMNWLGDSSGVAIGTTGTTTSLRILDRDGTIEQVAMQAAHPVLSLDGQWIAGTQVDPSDPRQDTVQVIARHGGTSRTLARGADFLGWLNGQVVYVASGIVSTVAPMGGTARMLAQLPAGAALNQVVSYPMTGPATSPDGTVLTAMDDHGGIWLLSAAGLRQAPIHMQQATPVLWVGDSHDALGSSGRPAATATIIDVLTGAVVRDTGAPIAGDPPQAISGDWLLGTVLGSQPTQLAAVNYTTDVSHIVGPLPPAATILALGPHGRFLLVDSTGACYLVDPTKG